MTSPADIAASLARAGVATVYEASGRHGLVQGSLIQIVPGPAVAGAALTVRCGQGDNLMVHAAIGHAQPGDVLVLTMPEPAPVALVGELLATQAHVRGVAGVLVDAAVRDVDQLARLGLPIWCRFISVAGATKKSVGAVGEPVVCGGAVIRAGDLVVMDRDGACVVGAERGGVVAEASLARCATEEQKRTQLLAGALSYDLDGLKERIEG